MSSTHPLAESVGISCSITLRVRHPSLDPDTITRTLGVKPDHFWGCGQPRRSAAGAKLSGKHRDTYWSAILPETLSQHLPSYGNWAADAGALLTRHLLQLKRHRAFFDQIRNEGGDACLVVELVPQTETFRLDAAVIRQLSDLGLTVELELITQTDPVADMIS